MDGAAAVDVPLRVGVHFRFQSEDAPAVRYGGVVRTIIDDLRHQQVKGREGHREADEVECGCRLEATDHE